MSPQRRLQLKRKAAHQCYDCGVSVKVGTRCDSCRIKMNERRQIGYTHSRLLSLLRQGLISPRTVIHDAKQFL